MSDATVEPGARDVKRLVDAALERLDADEARLRRALRSAIGRATDVATPDVLHALARTKRDLLDVTATTRVLRTTHPAKALALGWLTDLLAGYEAFRLTVTGPVADTRKHEHVALAHFTAATSALLALDHALGCPYGCSQARTAKRG